MTTKEEQKCIRISVYLIRFWVRQWARMMEPIAVGRFSFCSHAAIIIYNIYKNNKTGNKTANFDQPLCFITLPVAVLMVVRHSIIQ